MSELQKELTKVIDVTIKRGEERQAFLTRIIRAIDKLSDKEFNKLSKPAQRWANKATAAWDDEKEIPDFPDLEEEEVEETAPKKTKSARTKSDESEEDEADTEEAEPEEEEAEPEEEESSVARKSKRAAKAAKPAAKVKAKSKGRTTGGPTLIMQIMSKNPTISKTDIIKELKKKGVKLSELTVATIRAQFRSAMRVLDDAGKLTGIKLD